LKTKVYHGVKFFSDVKAERLVLVRAETYKDAVELLGRVGIQENRASFRNFWVKTGSPLDLSTATERGVWRGSTRFPTKPEDFARLV
jgi:hypothetical protein